MLEGGGSVTIKEEADGVGQREPNDEAIGGAVLLDHVTYRPAKTHHLAKNVDGEASTDTPPSNGLSGRY